MSDELLTKCGKNKADLIALGFTHIAKHKYDSPTGQFKKGQSMFVKFNPESGEYACNSFSCLLDPETNYDIEEL